MINTVVVPLDGSALAEHALEPAERLARRLHAAIEVVHVFDPVMKSPLVSGAPPVEMRLERDLRAHAQAYVDGVAERARSGGGMRVAAKLLDGQVSDALIAHVGTVDHPLVVMTTHGRTGIRRALLGNVTDALVRSLTVPVLAIRTQSDDDAPVAAGFSRVLVPLADEEFGKDITECALDIFGTDGVEYVLFHAVVPMPFIPSGTEPVTVPPPVDPQRQAEVARNLLDVLAAPMRARGAHVHTRVVIHETPSRAILDAVNEENADVISMATHGYRGLTRVVLGSAAGKVVRHSPVPVLLVRPRDPDNATEGAAREPSHARAESPE